jgi:hypothetical protein
MKLSSTNLSALKELAFCDCVNGTPISIDKEAMYARTSSRQKTEALEDSGIR